MSRTILIVASGLSASSLMLVDSAVKGTALLVVAAIAVLVLRRDSAATRHLVWLLAMIALLTVPVLSAMLPAWRVLPAWARIGRTIPFIATSEPPARPQDVANSWPQDATAVEIERPAAMFQPPATLPDSGVDSWPAATTSQSTAIASARSWHWQSALPLVWAIGFGVLILRLVAARWLLWNAERQATVISSSNQRAQLADDPIVAAFQAAALQLGIGRPVTLLIHPDKAIPVVWGIFSYRLLFPAAAREWSGEQLRSVLLHELAHIQRRDTLAQLLAQIACALHWFNPLVWLAAWRLGVERERACDDLVLASGVRPSAYARHLLDVVTRFAPSRWTQSGGLAMARKSSLEGRLVAVLSENKSRRSVSVAGAIVALAVAVGVALPLAMLGAQETRAAAQQPAAPRRDQPMPEKPTPEKPTPEKPVPSEATKRPASGAQQLKLATEAKLKWGEPAGGLRMALAWPPALGEPGIGDAPEFYLVVQNVSQAAVRLTAGDAAPNPRQLMIRKGGRPLSAFSDEKPMPGDWLLAPREVALVRLFHPSEKTKDGRTVDAVIEQDVRVFPQYSLTAEVSIEKAPEGAWTGKLVTGQTRGSVDVIPPKHKDAQALYESWTTAARADGKIPGGVIALLGQSVRTFIEYNPTWATTTQLEKMLSRFDASRDWSGPDAVALLDELAAVQATPISMALDREYESTIRTGTPLAPELATAPWGETLPSGLRMAWLLAPSAAEHRLGSGLKSRILIHNAGKQAIVFRTRTWHQSANHQAHDARGAEIPIESTEWTTLGRLLPFRLAPGEFVELTAAGIGVGPRQNNEDWQDTRVGSWIDVTEKEEVTFTPDAVLLGDWNERPLPGVEPVWWHNHITARLSRHLPFPADAEARQLLLYRVAMELFGTPVSAEINAAFVADREPTALDSLAKRLVERPGLAVFSGSLQSGPTKFRVLPADPDAANKPRVATGPGRYTLGDHIRLVVSRWPDEERIVNEASIWFYAADPKADAPGKPVALALPDGYSTWAAAWMRGGTVLWLQQKSGIRSYDFTKPADVKETALSEPTDLQKVPQPVRDALRAALDVSAAATAVPAGPRPAAESPK